MRKPIRTKIYTTTEGHSVSKTLLGVVCPSKLVLIRNNETSFGTIQNKTFVSVVSFYTETEAFGVSIEPKQPEEQPKQVDREHILVFFAESLGLFRFVLVYLETFCFNCFASIPKQMVSMFRLNRNKQKTNGNSLIESIFLYFSEGLFQFVSVCFETVVCFGCLI
jgi:hypothetical protein